MGKIVSCFCYQVSLLYCTWFKVALSVISFLNSPTMSRIKRMPQAVNSQLFPKINYWWPFYTSIEHGGWSALSQAWSLSSTLDWHALADETVPERKKEERPFLHSIDQRAQNSPWLFSCAHATLGMRALLCR